MRSRAPYTIRSATDFFPSYIRQFINLVNTLSPNLASGKTSRFTAARRRDMAISLFRALGAVFRAALAAVPDALRIERAANDVIPDPREVLDSPTADQDDRMLLQIVPLARDIARHLETVRQADPRHFAQRGIRLFRRSRVDASANAALLRAGFHRGNLVARYLRPPRLADELVYRRHRHVLVQHDKPPDAIHAAGRSAFVPSYLHAPSQGRRARS